MLTKSTYLQKYHHFFVNIDFIKNDVKIAMLKVFFLVVLKDRIININKEQKEIARNSMR